MGAQIRVDAQCLCLCVALQIGRPLSLSRVLLLSDTHEGSATVVLLAAHDVSPRREHIALLDLPILTVQQLVSSLRRGDGLTGFA